MPSIGTLEKSFLCYSACPLEWDASWDLNCPHAAGVSTCPEDMFFVQIFSEDDHYYYYQTLTGFKLLKSQFLSFKNKYSWVWNKDGT